MNPAADLHVPSGCARAPALRGAVVICTRNRPTELARCLSSLAAQTRPPDAVVVVDASDDPDLTRQAAPRGCDRLPIRWIAAPPGLPRQRNIGIAAARASDVVLFLDDDVECEEGYVAAVLATFEADPAGEILGVGGLVTNAPRPRPSRLKNVLGLTSGRQGAVLASGRLTVAAWVHETTDVDWLSGCAMSLRTGVLAEEHFDEGLAGYARGEDAELTYRVRQRGRLVVEPRARLVHHLSPAGRPDAIQGTYDEIVHRHRRVATRRGVMRLRWFWISLAGQALGLALHAVVFRSPTSRQRFSATLRAAVACVRRPVPGP